MLTLDSPPMCSAAAHCYFESSTCVFSCDANLPFIFFLWNLTKCLISNGLIGFLALASGGWQLGKTMLLIWALIQLPLEPHTTMSSFLSRMRALFVGWRTWKNNNPRCDTADRHFHRCFTGKKSVDRIKAAACTSSAPHKMMRRCCSLCKNLKYITVHIE